MRCRWRCKTLNTCSDSKRNKAPLWRAQQLITVFFAVINLSAHIPDTNVFSKLPIIFTQWSSQQQSMLSVLGFFNIFSKKTSKSCFHIKINYDWPHWILYYDHFTLLVLSSDFLASAGIQETQEGFTISCALCSGSNGVNYSHNL